MHGINKSDASHLKANWKYQKGPLDIAPDH